MKNKINKALNAYGKEAVLVLKREMRIDRTVASGKTLNSIRYTVKGNDVSIESDSTLGIIDAGNRSMGSAPSSHDILKWMRDKNIRPRATRKGSSSFTNSSDRNMKASAFAIAKAIGEKGTIKRFAYRGSNILSRIESGSKAMRALETEVKEILNEEVQIIFNQI
tara:strand:- start:144 stop:638 length:495 start_codon:yes stop_codon:yes gene_type:complete